MVDCTFGRIGHVHLHINPARGIATVISSYQPNRAVDHASDIRQGRESEARLISAAPPFKYALEIFLANDQFGQSAVEAVRFLIGNGGPSRIEASMPSGARRVLASGNCTMASAEALQP